MRFVFRSVVFRQMANKRKRPSAKSPMAVTEQKPKVEDGDRRGGDLFIVDNTDGDWKVRDYLREWTDISHSFDIATGNLEIGALIRDGDMKSAEWSGPVPAQAIAKKEDLIGRGVIANIYAGARHARD